MMCWKNIALASALFLLLALVPGCGSEEEARGPINLLLITLDTLRWDGLGCYRDLEPHESPSPHIDALAKRSILYRNARVPRSQTWPSLCTIMTGLYPMGHGVRDNGMLLKENQATLASILSNAGYATGAFMASIPANKEGSPAQGFEYQVDGKRDPHDPKAPSGTHEVWDRRANKAAIDFVRSHRDNPFAVWVHLYDIHDPYDPPPGLLKSIESRYSGPLHSSALPKPDGKHQPLTLCLNEAMINRERLSPSDLAHLRNLYDAEIQGVDKKVGELLAVLEELGLMEKTLVVLTSDHGEELYDHNCYVYHDCSIYDSVLRVPLLIALPGPKANPCFVDLPVEITCLAPTLLAQLGIQPPKWMHDEVLLPLEDPGAAPAEDTPVYAEWEDKIFVVCKGRYKYVFNPEEVHPTMTPYFGKGKGGFPVEREEFYDLEKDPGETRNRAEENPELCRSMSKLIKAWCNLPGHVPEMNRKATLDENLIKHLEELGYVGLTGESHKFENKKEREMRLQKEKTREEP